MKRLVILCCLLVYTTIWWHYKNEIIWSDRYLSIPLPVPVVQTAAGYGGNMAGFAIFVKTAIFTGGNNLTGIDEATYAPALAQNYDAAARLYPKFIDTYFFNQSFLPHISREFAVLANSVHEHGISALPESLYIPFFKAYNHFRYLDEPLEAADIFADLTKKPDAPEWFGSLSSKLRARGGQLSAGRDMLLVMYEGETNELVRERYALELANFDRALMVQAMLNLYRDHHGQDAQELTDLVPDFLTELPELELGYTLEWDPPVLKLTHPAVK